MFDNNINTENGFDIFEKEYFSEKGITTGSNYMFGNGYLGYRGTHFYEGSSEYSACIVSDTYDKADGKWRELCNVPNGLFANLIVNDKALQVNSEEMTDYKRQIDLSAAILKLNLSSDDITVETERFAAMDRLHVLAMKFNIKAKKDVTIQLETGIDGNVWSINGEHFSEYNISSEGDDLLTQTITKEYKTDICVAENTSVDGDVKVVQTEKKNVKVITFKLSAGESLVIEKFASIYSSNDVENPKVAALEALAEAKQLGFEAIKKSHIEKWETMWNKYDIKIQGNLRDQTLVRFNLYHNIIHTPTHGLLPVGARGLSCQAYQGAAFWDQEIFNLPMYLYTNPQIAKNILTYRYKTIEGARSKAKKLGYRGAFYAWISGKSGEELCPDFFFKDIITGRKIRNNFNSWQIHVSQDIAYTIWRYYEVTGDLDFLVDFGAEMMLDISLFVLSRSFFNVDKRRYEFIRLLGPDEYHENVDNNVFTNYQSRYALTKTLEVCELMKEKAPDKLKAILCQLDITDETFQTFGDMINKIYIKEPNENKVIEQFDGYFDLEDVKPAKLAERLIDKAEYWGWPNGIAVHTQVLKQADLIQLFVMHDDFDDETLKANFDYYEPRTEHGSSLSPAMHSIIANKIGYEDMAYDYFEKSCTVDLYNANKAISGGTFIGGIHTASCGAVWQMVVFGYAGFSEYDDILHFRPRLPKAWDGYSFELQHKGNYINGSVTKDTITFAASESNTDAISVDVHGEKATIEPNKNITITL